MCRCWSSEAAEVGDGVEKRAEDGRESHGGEMVKM